MQTSLAGVRLLVQFTLSMIRPFWASVCVMIFVSAFWAFSKVTQPYLLKVLLDALIHTTAVVPIVPIALYIALFLMIALVGQVYRLVIEIYMIPRLRESIVHYCFSKMLQQSHQFYQNRFAGALGTQINDLQMGISELVLMVIDRFFAHTLTLVLTIYTLTKVHLVFGMIMSAWIMVFLATSLFFSRFIVHLSDAWAFSLSTLTGTMVDVFSNMFAVRLFAQQKNEEKRLISLVDETILHEQRLEKSNFILGSVYDFSFCLIQLFNMYFLLKDHQQGIITIGDFILVMTLNITVVDFLWKFTKDFSRFSKLLGRMVQALRAVEAPPHIQDASNATPLTVTHGEIIFDHVTFHYHGVGNIFHELSLTIAPGQKVGLVGYSGSGKSTFAHLLVRLYDVTSGRILIDGQDISLVTHVSLMDAIAFIPQDPTLFHRSIIENIRYGDSTATDEQVHEAARLAHADHFIRKLPEGYGTQVGERGVKLSGGQRQRIVIARALLKKGPILIFDEATSQLDSVTENYIQESLTTIMRGRTTLVIAHRLSTLIAMDRILVFEHGEIVQDDSHERLLLVDGPYKKMWKAQIGGFLPENIQEEVIRESSN
ncbi:MAG: ABC transporter ATP-binding protein [Candidatus Babeliales bacterium]